MEKKTKNCDLVAGLSTNPRKWSEDEIRNVWNFCRSNGGGKMELFPCVPGESPTWCRINENGKLIVWYYDGLCQTEHTFNPIPRNANPEP